MVEMLRVSSSSVAAVGYDEQAEDLFVEYISSGTYIYAGVPMPVYEDLMRSPSVGVFVNQVIKPTYTWTHL
jgi:lysyl-tRNA synthetase class 2